MLLLSSALAFLGIFASASGKKDVVCKWKSLSGTTYDLRPMTRSSKEESYYIKDGDIPCTPEIEPTYSYLWNICSEVTEESYPSDICDAATQEGAVLQYLHRQSDDYKECHVIGRYDKNNDDIHYRQLSESNPALGVSMTYPLGEQCPSGQLRSATIDVYCANVEHAIDNAQEPDTCAYHMVMRSYYGCPTTCPITKHGLCNSHGHCAYDSKAKKSYCYCNAGHHGDDCSKKSSDSSGSYDGYSVQVALLVLLLLITLGLTGVIGFMIYRVTQLRNEKSQEFDGAVRGAEMISHDTF